MAVLLVSILLPVHASEVADNVASTAPSENYVQETYVPYVRYKPQGGTQYACSCIQYSKYVLGRLNEFWGNAWNLQPTSPDPYIGGLVLTSEGPGHVAVITNIYWDSIKVIEANYVSCQITTRTIPLDSPVIRGFR